MGLWWQINAWNRGMLAFGNGDSRHPAWVGFQEYFPILMFALLLVSVLLMKRWFWHLVAVLSVPSLLLAARLALKNPLIGLPMVGYFALWFWLYYRFVWYEPKENDNKNALIHP